LYLNFALPRSIATLLELLFGFPCFISICFISVRVKNTKCVSCDTRHELKPALSSFLLFFGSLTHVEETFVPKQTLFKHPLVADMNFGLRLERRLSVHFHRRILSWHSADSVV
jgi:hypothetical protein